MQLFENQVKTVQKKIDGLKKQHQSELDALTTTDTHESQHIDLSPIVIKAHSITKQRSILTLTEGPGKMTTRP